LTCQKRLKKSAKAKLTVLKAPIIGVHIPSEANKVNIERILHNNKEVVKDLQECSDIITRNKENLAVKIEACIVKESQP